MTVEVFDLNLFVPTALHDASNPNGIIAIALVDLHLQGRLGMPSINADDWQPLLLELCP